ncbi:hypothetical protein Drorol1_Dr00000086, partial [Drosera rotundifolia]
MNLSSSVTLLFSLQDLILSSPLLIQISPTPLNHPLYHPLLSPRFTHNESKSSIGVEIATHTVQ